MTDFRRLCAALLDGIAQDVIDVNDGRRFQSLVNHARAELAKPVAGPVAPSDEEFRAFMLARGIVYDVDDDVKVLHTRKVLESELYTVLREVLARYGTTPTSALAAAERIRKFLDEYRGIKGLDPEVIYGVHGSLEGRAAAITASDLEALLAAMPLPAAPGEGA
jgi:hypothetical protein